MSLPQLADITSVEYRTLHTWVKRGLLRPSLHQSSGTGSPNRFTVDDAVAARVLADLRRSGLAMEVLEGAAEAMRSTEVDLRRPAVLLVNGHVEIFLDLESAAPALDRPGLSLIYRTTEALELVHQALASV